MNQAPLELLAAYKPAWAETVPSRACAKWSHCRFTVCSGARDVGVNLGEGLCCFRLGLNRRGARRLPPPPHHAVGRSVRR